MKDFAVNYGQVVIGCKKLVIMEIDKSWPEPMRVYNKRFMDLFGMPTQSAGQSGNLLTVRFSKGNHSFKDSIYYLNPAQEAFTHLTTYKGLFGIINSGTIRLYNLQNSNDPNELFTLSGVPTYGQAAENLKRHVYTFSFCKPDAFADPSMWTKYGQVAINFEIVNDPMRWDYHRISRIHYGQCNFVPKYEGILSELKKEFPEWDFQADLESLLSLLAFHKEDQHRSESEVRLLYVPFLFDDRRAHYDFRVSNIHTGMTQFVEIPLFAEGEARNMTISQTQRLQKSSDDSVPLIKIISIEFGDNQPEFSQTELTILRYELEDYLLAKFGYPIQVKDRLFKTGVTQK